MKKFIAAAIAALFAVVVCFSDPFDLILFGIFAIYIGIPGLLVAAVHLLVAIRKGRSRRPALTILSVVVAVGCFVGLAIPANHFVQERAVAAAKEYPARVAPLLEAYRQAHGAYPTTLEQLASKPAVPRLLRSSSGYRSDGSQYSFSFPQPGGLIDTWDYESETKTWHLST